MKIFRLILPLALLAALALAMAGPGHRMGLWEFSTGFTIMRWAAFAGLGLAVAALLLLLIPRTRSGNALALAAALVLGAVTVGIPWQGLQTARSVPPIHDITTDTENPPTFEAILPLREDAPNPPEYEGEEVAEQQREAYPEIVPLALDDSREQVFNAALAAARNMGWEIVDEDPEAGRIEATDTTFWFGFKDDVVIRITEEGDLVRVDVRSKSRVGMSDVGANARRIEAFMERLDRKRRES